MARQSLTSRFVSLFLVLLLVWTPAMSAGQRSSTNALRPPIGNGVRLEQVPFTPPSSGRWVLNIKDIHQNEEAQRSIASILENLVRTGSVDAILLEGTDQTLDFSEERTSPDKKLIEQVADFLLREGRISGPAFMGLTFPGSLPRMEGLEEAETYQANIEALQKALSLMPRMKNIFPALSERLTKAKKKTFDSDLMVVDLGMKRYESGRMPLTSVISFLRHRGASLDSLSRSLLENGAWKGILRSGRIGAELQNLLERLAEKSTPEDSAALLDLALRFQRKETSAAHFAAVLFDLSSRNNIPLDSYAHLAARLKASAFLETVSTSDLTESVDRLHAQMLEKLADTNEEKDVVRLSRAMLLLKKLAVFSLSPAEWNELRAMSFSVDSDDPVIQKLADDFSFVRNRLLPHRNFYKVAETRNDRFVERILRQFEKPGARGVVIVTGGFHSEAVRDSLLAKGIVYVSCVPATTSVARSQTSEALWRLANENTLAAPPAPLYSRATLAVAAIAKGHLKRNFKLKEWGINRLKQLQPSISVKVHRGLKSGRAYVTGRRMDGSKEVYRIDFQGEASPSIVQIKPRLSFAAPYVIRAKGFVLRAWYFFFGLKITGVALHSGRQATIHIFPRGKGNGINFIRTDVKDRSLSLRSIPARIGFLRRNRLRFSGLESFGNQVATVEHLLFSLRVIGVWNADVTIDGDELPILDGSAAEYIRRLRWLKATEKKPDKFRSTFPLSYRRDDDTAIIVLPLEKGEEHSEFIFVGNYPGMNVPIESKIVFDEEAGLARIVETIGDRQTFVERPLRGLQSEGKFLGAQPGINIIQVKGAEQLAANPELARRVAQHKGGIDLIGDMFLLELANNRRLHGRVIALGTGHRDTAELMYRMQSGYELPLKYTELVHINLQKLKDAKKISDELFEYICRRLERFRAYDIELRPAINQLSSPEIEKLRGITKYMGDPSDEKIVELFNAVREYLLSSNGSALFEIADSIATQQFRPDKIQQIKIRLSEQTETEAVFEVSFARRYGEDHDWPKVAVVVSLDDNLERFSLERTTTGAAQEHQELFERAAQGDAYQPPKASDHRMGFFPLLGPYKQIKMNGWHGVYSRQWHSKDFAQILPIESKIASSAEPFRAMWKNTRDGEFWQRLSNEQQQNFAKRVAEILTSTFLRIYERPYAYSGVPLEGRVIEDIDPKYDFLFDPIEQKVMLSKIRSVRLTKVEDLLNQIFHITHTKRHEQIPLDTAPLMTEWQFLSGFPEYLVEGIESALITQFGELNGRKAALEWFRRYLAYIDSHGPTDPKMDHPDKTWAVRVVAVKEGRHELVSGKRGPFLKPVLQSAVDRLGSRIKELEKEQVRDAVSGSARWLVEAMSMLTSFSPRTWIKLAPLTEAFVFPGMGIVAGAITNYFLDFPLAGGVVGALVSQMAWMASHQTILVAGTWRSASESVEARNRVYKLGWMTAVLPTISVLTGSWPLALLVFPVSIVTHRLFNDAGASQKPMGGGVLERRRRGVAGRKAEA